MEFENEVSEIITLKIMTTILGMWSLALLL